MTLNKAYEILERYYLTVYDTFQFGNMESYDVDSAYTKVELENILAEQPELSDRGSNFLKELLSDDIGESVADAIHTILDGNL